VLDSKEKGEKRIKRTSKSTVGDTSELTKRAMETNDGLQEGMDVVNSISA
jgi:hypothetical protein